MKGSMLKSPAAARAQQHQLQQQQYALGYPPKNNKKQPSKLCKSPPKMRFQDPVGRNLPPSLQNFRWNVDKVERKLQEKIQEKTKIAGNFVYQQAYRLLEGSRGDGIDFPSFREQLRIKFGIILDDEELLLLFDKYDEDRNGMIDLNEFIRRVLPPDYNYGKQWFEVSQAESEAKQLRLKRESRNEFLSGLGLPPVTAPDEDDKGELNNTGETTNWTLETLTKQIQAKVVQKTPGGDDQYRRAFKMLRSGRDKGIRITELRNNLKTKFGIFVSETQMNDLFRQFDGDGSGEIDLQEFLQFVEPPAYPGNSFVPNGLWTESAHEEYEVYEEDEHDYADYYEGPDDIYGAKLVDRALSEAESVADNEMETGRLITGAVSTASLSSYGGKKERPKSANPKKSALLQQRRQQLEQARLHLNTLQAANAGASVRPVSGRMGAGRMSMSLADISPGHLEALGIDQRRGIPPQHNQRPVQHAYNDDDAPAAARLERPRSAGSVRSYSAGSSVSSGSVRGAAYLKRTTTAQHLRQKCLESRIAAANEISTKKNERLNTKKRATVGPGMHNAADTKEDHTRMARANATSRRHSCSDSVSVYSYTDSEGESVASLPVRRKSSAATSGPKVGFADRVGDYTGDFSQPPPRIVRVHEKQHDVRPFSAGGRVLTRNKVHSTGCR